MVLCVEHVVGNTALFEHIAEHFRLFNGDCAHENGLIFRMSINNFVNNRAEFGCLCLIDDVGHILADYGLVGGNFHNVKSVNLAEFVRFRHGGTGHA